MSSSTHKPPVEYPLHLGERNQYHVIEYPQGYSGLLRPDGTEVTSLTEPEDIHWHRDLKPIVDELNKQAMRIAELEAQLSVKEPSKTNHHTDDMWDSIERTANSLCIAAHEQNAEEAEKLLKRLQELMRPLTHKGVDNGGFPSWYR